MRAAVQTWWSLLRGGRGHTHAQRLEDFYRLQAEHYDRSRERLLHGRNDLLNRISIEPGAHVIELGGGTGRNLECFGERLQQAGCVELVDLCQPLLDIAARRVAERGWQQVRLINADATSWRSQQGLADVVYCSYSLTMIPDWYAAIDNALRLLRPGGTLAVVDFYISRKHPAAGRRKHSWLSRTLWPAIFAHDGVHLHQDLLPYLDQHAETLQVEERQGSSPWLPFARIPYFLWIGLKREESVSI